ncbi:hypothetical protein BJ085DRAFT_18207 [Dimargaris cristalligena]|uniref:protein-histidine N-methyltransferase n=1 Tax=Dimargaris cristalligena TaxID=215637 RepID=A0A4Q0A1P8_9FUNG|nr:hypothetical protein BJ085DRAFT_18207 [Dimargaris cristalligena]|eukprot:RKP39080.1 hypothetical protein BJ085DRAFT_18207 [Dimargaris cristalligena]
MNGTGSSHQEVADIPERTCREILLTLDRLPPIIIADPVPIGQHPTSTPDGQCLYRRQLSDVRYQLAQDDTMSDPMALVRFMDRVESTDLIKGVYEGGMKTWECSVDLVNYLAEHWESLQLENKKIIELGCGSALPSIFCLQQTQSAQVHLQDYNAEVLQLITLPNLVINTVWRSSTVTANPTEEVEIPIADRRDEMAQSAAWTSIRDRCRLVAGDWRYVVDHLQQQQQQHPTAAAVSGSPRYDLILTSETIYNQASQAKLYELIKGLLAPGGMALIAAKLVYFGCDGNVHTFTQLVEGRGEFKLTRLGSYGQHIRREILKMEFL